MTGRVCAAGVLVASWALSAGCGSDVGESPDAGDDAGPTVILDGGGEIPTPPDGAALCPSGPCNYQTGDGCSGATPSCLPFPVPDGGVAPLCQAAGAGTSGAACAAWTDCAPGYVCAAGACHKLCCGGDWTGCPSPDEHCIRALRVADGMGGSVDTGAMLCDFVNTCDALAPASCAEPGTACLIVDPTGATACFPEGTGAAGEPCPCRGGFLCVADACRRLCKAVEGGGEPSCPVEEGVCVHFQRDPPGVGECTPLD